MASNGATVRLEPGGTFGRLTLRNYFPSFETHSERDAFPSRNSPIRPHPQHEEGNEMQASSSVNNTLGNGHPSPTVSVVIPALNEERNLPHVFAKLPADVTEVIVVDG